MSNLNVDSSKYKVRGSKFGGYQVIEKETNRTVSFVELDLNTLIYGTEEEFDEYLKGMMEE